MDHLESLAEFTNRCPHPEPLAEIVLVFCQLFVITGAKTEAQMQKKALKALPGCFL